MTIEPKLLSGKELAFCFDLSDHDGHLLHESVYNVFAHIAALNQQIAAKDAEIERLKVVIEQAAKQFRHIMRNAEMSSGIMLDPKRTGNWVGARKTADAFDRIGLRAAESKADVLAALTPQPKDQSHG